jgi:uracil-DNA glycosylase
MTKLMGQFQGLACDVTSEYRTKNICPPSQLIFRAFKLTPFENTRVVILGQDPYHGPDQADGLAFSMNRCSTPQTRPLPLPRSLQNIIKKLGAEGEIKDNLLEKFHKGTLNGILDGWAEQGVLLLNSFLTVMNGNPGSHHKIGWEQLTNDVIKALAYSEDNLVFILWGVPAKNKAYLIHDANSKKNPHQHHRIIQSSHPSPYSAYGNNDGDDAFFQTEHFNEANRHLYAMGKGQIQWDKLSFIN